MSLAHTTLKHNIVVPTTAGEQKVIDTWDLTSLDGARRLLFKLNI